MKTNYRIIAALLLVSLTSYGQETVPKVALEIALVNTYHSTLGNSAINNYGSLGGNVNVVFNNTYFVGYSQNKSFLPDNLMKQKISGASNLRINEYALSFGRNWNVVKKIYLTGNLKVGIGEFQLGTYDDSEWDDFFNSESHISLLVAAQTGMGFHINKYFAVEGGIDFRRYLNNNTTFLGDKDLSSLAFHVSLVGTIPLTK